MWLMGMCVSVSTKPNLPLKTWPAAFMPAEMDFPQSKVFQQAFWEILRLINGLRQPSLAAS